jgi:hypothetical protein
MRLGSSRFIWILSPTLRIVTIDFSLALPTRGTEAHSAFMEECISNKTSAAHCEPYAATSSIKHRIAVSRCVGADTNTQDFCSKSVHICRRQGIPNHSNTHNVPAFDRNRKTPTISCCSAIVPMIRGYEVISVA